MLWIKNGKILTMAGRVFETGNIGIENGKIAVVDNDVVGVIKNNDMVIDADGLWVLPGFIDAHSHIGLTEEKIGMEGDDCNESTLPITPYLRAIDAINPFDPAFHNALQAGITSVMVGPGSTNVVGGQFAFIKTHGRNIEDMVVLEPAAIKVAFGENVKSNFKGKDLAPSSRMTIASMLREELFHAKNYKNRKDEAKKRGDSFELDFKLEPWLPILNKEIPIKAHVHRTDDILTAIRIAKEFDINLTLDHCTEGHIIADEIRESGYPAILGPDLASRNKIECQNGDFKTSGVLDKKGIKVAITTDHPVSLIQFLPICAGYAAKRGLGMMGGIKAITINAAHICGVADRVGSIEVGKDADIAIFTGNPMEVFSETVYTIVDGEVVYQREKTERYNSRSHRTK